MMWIFSKQMCSWSKVFSWRAKAAYRSIYVECDCCPNINFTLFRYIIILLSISEVILKFILHHNSRQVSLREKLFSERCVFNGQFLTICIQHSGKVKYAKVSGILHPVAVIFSVFIKPLRYTQSTIWIYWRIVWNYVCKKVPSSDRLWEINSSRPMPYEPDWKSTLFYY